MLQLIISILVILSDQISKVILDPFLKNNGGTFPLIPGVVELRLAHNTGVALGMFSDLIIITIILTSVIICLLIFVVYKTRSAKSILYKISTGLILSGAISNLADRIFLGYVRDFFNFQFVNFAIFNVADISITCGGILLGIYLIFYAKKDKGITIYELMKDKNTDEPSTTENNKEY